MPGGGTDGRGGQERHAAPRNFDNGEQTLDVRAPAAPRSNKTRAISAFPLSEGLIAVRVSDGEYDIRYLSVLRD